MKKVLKDSNMKQTQTRRKYEPAAATLLLSFIKEMAKLSIVLLTRLGSQIIKLLTKDTPI